MAGYNGGDLPAPYRQFSRTFSVVTAYLGVFRMAAALREFIELSVARRARRCTLLLTALLRSALRRAIAGR